MKVQFTKMHGIGNDFVVIDAINQAFNIDAESARFLADRRYGVGCDQILIVEAAQSDDVLFRYRILNADGSEVSQCGNGARCFARFVHDKGLTSETSIPVETHAGKMILHLHENGEVSVDMGAPVLEPTNIPFLTADYQASYSLTVDGENIEIGAISMGNPHAVILVDNIDSAPVETLGAKIEHHPQFPERVNVGFMQVLSPAHIRLRVFERGAGETLACGSGAAAAVVSGILRGKLQNHVKVDLPGGQLMVKWKGSHKAVILTGPAASVFEGTIDI